ncbi:hypothetical protein, partial [Nocardiopsis coralliicola]
AATAGAALAAWAAAAGALPAASSSAGALLLAAGLGALATAVLLAATAFTAPAGRRAPQQRQVFGLRLYSGRSDVPFLFSAVVCWRGPRGAGRGDAAEADAVRSVTARAQQAAAVEQPEDHAAARFRVAALLGPEACGADTVEAWAERVQLDLAPADAEYLARLRELRRDRALRAAEPAAHAGTAAGPAQQSGRSAAEWLAADPDRIQAAAAALAALAGDSAAAVPSPGVPAARSADGAPSERTGGQEPPHAAAHGPSIADAVGDDPVARILGAGGSAYGYTPSAPSPVAEPFSRDAGPEGDHAPWLAAASAALADWEDEEEYEGFLERFAVFLKSNGYTETAARLRKEHGLGPGFAAYFGSDFGEEDEDGDFGAEYEDAPYGTADPESGYADDGAPGSDGLWPDHPEASEPSRTPDDRDTRP